MKPDDTLLRDHPELAFLAVLDAQLGFLPRVLAGAHSADTRDALADQARSLARVGQLMRDQLAAYEGIIEVGAQGNRKSRPRTR